MALPNLSKAWPGEMMLRMEAGSRSPSSVQVSWSTVRQQTCTLVLLLCPHYTKLTAACSQQSPNWPWLMSFWSMVSPPAKYHSLREMQHSKPTRLPVLVSEQSGRRLLQNIVQYMHCLEYITQCSTSVQSSPGLRHTARMGRR